jgi:hypothetical protein
MAPEAARIDDSDELVIEVDGEGVHLDTLDAAGVLNLAVAYLECFGAVLLIATTPSSFAASARSRNADRWELTRAIPSWQGARWWMHSICLHHGRDPRAG